MPWYRMRSDLGGVLSGAFHIKVPRRNATPACSVCGYIGERQCDRILTPYMFIHGEPKRCDRWLCTYCSFQPEKGKDLCPQCALLFKAWLAARTNSTDGAG